MLNYRPFNLFQGTSVENAFLYFQFVWFCFVVNTKQNQFDSR